MLNAFWRVAPSERLSALAILFAGIFFLASDLSSRTCTDVQGRLFDAFLAMMLSDSKKRCAYSWKCFQKKERLFVAPRAAPLGRPGRRLFGLRLGFLR